MAKLQRRNGVRRALARRFAGFELLDHLGAGASRKLAQALLISAAALVLAPPGTVLQPALAQSAAAPSQADPANTATVLSDGSAGPEQLRILGYQLLAAGDLGSARLISEALIDRDPKDAPSLLLRAQAAQGMGDFGRSRIDARKAWRHAETGDAKFAAALLVAQSLAVDGYLNRSQLWLRLAAADAPDASGKALVASEYNRVRSRNPLLVELSFSARPSSNVNSGSTADYFRIPISPDLSLELPLGGAQKALRGYEARLGADLTWRLPPTAERMTAFHLSTEHRAVSLSSGAQASAPEVTGSDFNYSRLELGVSQRWRPKGGDTTYHFSGWIGHDRQGGEALSNNLRLNAQMDRVLTPKVLAFAGVSAERSHRLDVALRSTDAVGLSLGSRFMAFGRDRVTLVFGIGRVDSDSLGNRSDRRSVRLGWTRGQPVLGMGLEAWLSLEERDYPQSPYRRDGRHDLRTTLNLVMSFDQIDYMGFTPTLDVMASRNRSDVGLFEQRDLGLQFGFRSAF